MELVRFAKEMYEEHRMDLVRFLPIVSKLERAIGRTQEYMISVGIKETCRICAMETGSCCKRGMERIYGVEILLINLLMGVELPERRYREDLCFFCGKNGCRLKAREGICVTYLCDRIDVDRTEFNKVCSLELGYLSLLKVKLRRFLDQRVPRSSSFVGFWRSHHPKPLSSGRYTFYDDEGRSTLRRR